MSTPTPPAASAPQGDTLREVAAELADGMTQIAVALGMDTEAGEVGPIVERVRAWAASPAAPQPTHAEIRAAILGPNGREPLTAAVAATRVQYLLRQSAPAPADDEAAQVERMAAALARLDGWHIWLIAMDKYKYRKQASAALAALKEGQQK